MLVFHVVCILSSSLVLLINPDLGRVAAFPYSDLCLPRSSLHVALFLGGYIWFGDEAAIVSAVPLHRAV